MAKPSCSTGIFFKSRTSRTAAAPWTWEVQPMGWTHGLNTWGSRNGNPPKTMGNYGKVWVVHVIYGWFMLSWWRCLQFHYFLFGRYIELVKEVEKSIYNQGEPPCRKCIVLIYFAWENFRWSERSIIGSWWPLGTQRSLTANHRLRSQSGNLRISLDLASPRNLRMPDWNSSTCNLSASPTLAIRNATDSSRSYVCLVILSMCIQPQLNTHKSTKNTPRVGISQIQDFVMI